MVVNLKTAKALGLKVPSSTGCPHRRGDRMTTPGAKRSVAIYWRRLRANMRQPDCWIICWRFWSA